MSTDWNSKTAKALLWTSTAMFGLLCLLVLREFCLREWNPTYKHFMPYMVFQTTDKYDRVLVVSVVLWNMFGGMWILLARLYDWRFHRPKAEVEVCHACGQDASKSVTTSSDPRSRPTPLCNRCFDECVLSERWATWPGKKWFDRKKT